MAVELTVLSTILGIRTMRGRRDLPRPTILAAEFELELTEDLGNIYMCGRRKQVT